MKKKDTEILTDPFCQLFIFIFLFTYIVSKASAVPLSTCACTHAPEHTHTQHTLKFLSFYPYVKFDCFGDNCDESPPARHRSLSDGVISAALHHPRIALSHKNVLTGLGKIFIIFKIVYSVGKCIIKGFGSFLNYTGHVCVYLHTCVHVHTCAHICKYSVTYIITDEYIEMFS